MSDGFSCWTSMVLLLFVVPSGLTGQDLTLEETGAEERIGSFYYFHNQDDFDDTDRSMILTLEADDATPSLGWACTGVGFTVMLNMGSYYGGDRNDRVRVRYRFDQTPASDRENWQLLQNNRSAYISGTRVEDFTDAALAASGVVLEAVDPLDSEIQRFTFSLDGLSDALGRLPCS